MVDSVSTFFINGNQSFINGPRSQPRDLPDCFILGNCIFDSFLFTYKLFAKGLSRYETCLPGNIKLYGKIVSLLPIMFDYNLRVTSAALFVADFNL